MELKKYYRKLAIKGANICAIICLVIIAVFCAFAGKSILSWITGPKEIKPGDDLSKYENQYVTMDIQYVMAEYVRVKTQTKTKSGTVTSTKLSKIGYLIYNREETEGGYVENYFGILLPAKEETDMDKRIDSFWEYMAAETDQKPKKFTVTGTIRPIEGSYKTYYDKTMKEIDKEVTGTWGFKNVAYFELDDFYIGKLNDTTTYLCFAAVLLTALVGVIYYMNAMLNYDSKFKKFLKNHPNYTENEIDMAFSQAERLNKDIFYGSRFLFFKSGSKFDVIELSEFVWAYYYKRTGKNSVSEMRYYNMQRKLTHVPAAEQLSHDILNRVYNDQPHMVVGYTKEVEQCFNRDFNNFLNIRYNPSKNVMTAPVAQETTETAQDPTTEI